MEEVRRVESLANGSGFLAGKISARILAGVAAAALLLALALLSGCGGGTEATPEGGGLVQGLVVAVEGRSITELESLAIRDEAGKIWTFASGASFVGFTASHLREHQLLGQPVVVTYVVEGDTLVVVDIAD
jgi:hypothetical protein